MSKKLLAIVLALVTCLTMLPVTAAAGVRLPLAEQFGAAETRVSLTTGAKLTAEPEACSHDTWTPWTTQTDLPTESGSYYLDTDVKLEETWEIPTGTTINLCLNGHVIWKDGGSPVIRIYGGAALNLYDCNTTTEHKFKNSTETDGLWVLDNALEGDAIKHTVIGGVITGGYTGGDGVGGVYISEDGSFTMHGGTVCGNRSETYYPGGVQVNGNFTMYDGAAICGNANKSSGFGGVDVQGGSFKMLGGVITDNTSAEGVGGVSVSAGSFKMTAGKICGNRGAFGGMAVGESVEVILGGSADISGNTELNGKVERNVMLINEVSSKLQLATGTDQPNAMHVGVTMLKPNEETGGYDSIPGQFINGIEESAADHFFADDEAYQLQYDVSNKCLELAAHNHDGIEFEAWASATELPAVGGNWVLTTDVTLADTWTVPAEATPTNLCLNGHVIKMAENVKKRVINVPNNTTLNLYDCDKETKHYFKDSAETYGLWVLDDTLVGDAIKHTVIGGVITGGVNPIGPCGGVNTNGNFTMYGGTISGNTAKMMGGGVMVGSGNFKMYGGTISGNTADNIGGGVMLGGGNFKMYGGTISSNTAKMMGGGVAVAASFTVGGTAVIENNTDAGGACNVWLNRNACDSITIATGEDAPKDGMYVGVTIPDKETGEPTFGQFTDNGAKAGYATYFFSDDDAYKVAYNAEGKYLELVEDNGSALLHLLRAALVTVTTVHHLICGVTNSAARIARIAAFNAALPVMLARLFWHF